MQPPLGDWSSYIQHAEMSDVGMRRNNNQDAFAAVPATSEQVWLNRGHVFMVADGMGAHAAGELASEIATETVPHNYFKLTNLPPPLALRTAILEANSRIHDRGQADSEFHGMGTTSSVLVLMPQGAMVAHVGDSRVYRLRGNMLEQLSFDHSLVWEMMQGGRLREEDVPSYIPKNVITRSLGPNGDVEVDLEGPFPLAVGDTFLLCSDGLTGHVKDAELGAVLMSLPPDEAVRALVALANLRGGKDNITVLIVRVVARAATSGEVVPLPPPPDTKPKTARSWKGLAFTWTSLVLLALAVLPLLLMQQAIAAGVSAALAAVAAGFLRFKFGVGSGDDDATVMFGKGPHTSRACNPDESFSASLAQMIDDLKRSPAAREWHVDWSQFDKLGDAAQAAAGKKKYHEAVRDYCRAISFMIREVQQSKIKPE